MISARRQRSGFQPMHPAGIVNSQNVVIGSGLRFDEIGWLGEALCEQPIVNEPVLARGKHMVAEIEIVARMVNQLEREHPSTAWSARRYCCTATLCCSIVFENWWPPEPSALATK